jgi:hypothetical protein
VLAPLRPKISARNTEFRYVFLNLHIRKNNTREFHEKQNEFLWYNWKHWLWLWIWFFGCVSSIKYDFIKTIYTYFPLIAILFGNFGNTISLLIFNHKKFASAPFIFYQKAGSIIETSIFFVGCLKYFLQANYGNPLTASLFWCKFLSFLLRPILETVAWIQVMITINIYLLSNNSRKFNFWA